MAKVKKGDKVKVGKRSCKVTSVSGSSFSVNCGPPAGKKKKKGGKQKAKSSTRRSSKRGGKRSKRGLGEIEAPKVDAAAMKRAKARLADAIKFTRGTLADEKRTGRADARGQVLDIFYAEELNRPAKAKKARTIYSRADPRFHAGIAGTKKR